MSEEEEDNGFLYDPRYRRHTKRRHDPGRKIYGNLSGRGYHFVSRHGRTRYDPRYRRYYGRAKGGLGKALPYLAGIGSAFVSAIGKDISYHMGKGDGYSLNGMLSDFIARTTGQQVDVLGYKSGLKGPTVKLSGALNKVSVLGAGMMGYSMIPGMPKRALVKKLSWPVLLGGAVGGIFDPDLTTTTSQGPYQVAPSSVRSLTSV